MKLIADSVMPIISSSISDVAREREMIGKGGNIKMKKVQIVFYIHFNLFEIAW